MITRILAIVLLSFDLIIPLRCSLAAIDLVIAQRMPDSLYQPWERAQTCLNTCFHVHMTFPVKRGRHGRPLRAMNGPSGLYAPHREGPMYSSAFAPALHRYGDQADRASPERPALPASLRSRGPPCRARFRPSRHPRARAYRLSFVHD